MDLKSILEKHLKWVDDESSGERADLSRANLSGADLSGVCFDFSCWGLSCKTLDIGKSDAKLCAQLLYHTLRVIEKCDDQEMKKLLKLKTLLKQANKFHRAVECGKVGK